MGTDYPCSSTCELALTSCNGNKKKNLSGVGLNSWLRLPFSINYVDKVWGEANILISRESIFLFLFTLFLFLSYVHILVLEKH